MSGTSVRTVGISPKVLYGAIAGLVGFVATKFGVHLDPVLEQALNVALVSMVAALAPPGIVDPAIGPASDDLLNEEASKRVRGTRAR